ncbi:flavodoxin domain-containing protein [Streptomyces sp. NBC_01465]|uniref:flavodoxin domain-containing protein n=1 Tax=Streptomyces sp. NBC_01465 TaxID=2903878 RepID=UPI002E3243CA|nr:flavodoxin domain-containing protein [Streptomyces sp. NBC_01465]
MTATVLIAYASREGATVGIARTLAAALDEHGLHTRVTAAADVQDLHGCDAVVLGSALYAGRWLKDARTFARIHRRALAELPLWLFSSGPLDDSATTRSIPPVAGVARTARRLRARGHITIGGALQAGATGRMARMLLAQGRGGDFRDPEQIRTFATRIAGALSPATHP